MPTYQCELAGCSKEILRRNIIVGDTKKRVRATLCRPCWVGLQQELESTNTSESRRKVVNRIIAKQPFALKVQGNFFHLTPGFENKSNGACECGRPHSMPSPVLCFKCRDVMSFKVHEVGCDEATRQKLLARIELSKEVYNKFLLWKKTQSRDKNSRPELRTEQELQQHKRIRRNRLETRLLSFMDDVCKEIFGKDVYVGKSKPRRRKKDGKAVVYMTVQSKKSLKTIRRVL